MAERHQDSEEAENNIPTIDDIAKHLNATKLEEGGVDEVTRKPIDAELNQTTEYQPSELEDPLEHAPPIVPLYEDPPDDDDGEGEWITPTNVSLHKSHVLQLIPSKGRAKERVVTGCMTTDFAMQNVLLHMGLSLVGVDGKKIDRVKTWVLRCHACFK